MLRICLAIDFNTKLRCAMRSMLILQTFTDIHRASLKNKNLRLKIEGWRLKIRLKIFGTGHGAVISWKCYNSGEINITVVTAQNLFYLKLFCNVSSSAATIFKLKKVHVYQGKNIVTKNNETQLLIMDTIMDHIMDHITPCQIKIMERYRYFCSVLNYHALLIRFLWFLTKPC